MRSERSDTPKVTQLVSGNGTACLWLLFTVRTVLFPQLQLEPQKQELGAGRGLE